MPPLQSSELPIREEQTITKFYSSKLINLVSILLDPTIIIFLLRANLLSLGKEKAARNATITAIFVLIIKTLLLPLNVNGFVLLTLGLVFVVYVHKKLLTDDDNKSIENAKEQPPLFIPLVYGCLLGVFVFFCTRIISTILFA